MAAWLGALRMARRRRPGIPACSALDVLPQLRRTRCGIHRPAPGNGHSHPDALPAWPGEPVPLWLAFEPWDPSQSYQPSLVSAHPLGPPPDPAGRQQPASLGDRPPQRLCPPGGSTQLPAARSAGLRRCQVRVGLAGTATGARSRWAWLGPAARPGEPALQGHVGPGNCRGAGLGRQGLWSLAWSHRQRLEPLSLRRAPGPGGC